MAVADGAGSALPAGGTAPHVLVDDVEDPVLTPDADHHLRRVRRLRPGAPCTVGDGRGRWRAAVLGHGVGAVEAAGEVVVVPRPEPALTVAIALTKGAKPDWTVQKLTEIGIDRIVLVAAARSVVRWDDVKAEAQRTRLDVIARGAVEQSRRAWAPSVEGVRSVAEMTAEGAVALDRGGRPLDHAHSVVLVGPEGGWDDAERGSFSETVGVGENVLRAETAALTAGVLMVSLRSRILRIPPDGVHGA